MKQSTTTTGGAVTIGLDVSDRFSEAYVIDAQGCWIESLRIPTTKAAFETRLAQFEGARVVLEVGAHSPWISRQLQSQGLEVVVANPRRVRLIAESDSKTDRFDAEQLARLGRIDPALLSPIVHRSEQSQRDRVRLRVRDSFVRTRTALINQARGFAKSLGSRLPSSSSEAFPARVRAAVPADLFPGLSTLLGMIERLTSEIRQMDREIQRLCAKEYPETGTLRQVTGVGALTALSFVLTLEDPHRFARSRAVGAYLGLRPRLRDSGNHKSQLRITKRGDHMLRRLLVGSAQYILGPFGPDTDLRRFGMRLAEHGGKAAKKRAAVAVARKLAILLHRLWRTGEEYHPLAVSDRKQLLEAQA
jgi:transposase